MTSHLTTELDLPSPAEDRLVHISYLRPGETLAELAERHKVELEEARRELGAS